MPSLFRRPVRRTRNGRYALTLSTEERAILRALVPSLRAALEDPAAPGLRRLFPPAYGNDEPDKQEEYARLMQADLVERHGAALDVLEQTAIATELSGEELDTWARALNQLRLELGTRLDVTEEDDPLDDDPLRQLYHYLGYLQENVVDALMGPG